MKDGAGYPHSAHPVPLSGQLKAMDCKQAMWIFWDRCCTCYNNYTFFWDGASSQSCVRWCCTNVDQDVFWRTRWDLSYLLRCLLPVRCLQVGVNLWSLLCCCSGPHLPAGSTLGIWLMCRCCISSPAHHLCSRGYPWSAEIEIGLVFPELEPRRTGWSWLLFLMVACTACGLESAGFADTTAQRHCRQWSACVTVLKNRHWLMALLTEQRIKTVMGI